MVVVVVVVNGGVVLFWHVQLEGCGRRCRVGERCMHTLPGYLSWGGRDRAKTEDIYRFTE